MGLWWEKQNQEKWRAIMYLIYKVVYKDIGKNLIDQAVFQGLRYNMTDPVPPWGLDSPEKVQKLFF